MVSWQPIIHYLGHTSGKERGGGRKREGEGGRGRDKRKDRGGTGKREGPRESWLKLFAICWLFQYLLPLLISIAAGRLPHPAVTMLPIADFAVFPRLTNTSFFSLRCHRLPKDAPSSAGWVSALSLRVGVWGGTSPSF